MAMRGVPWWGLVSSAVAPVALIGGWTVAAARQRGGFDPVTRTISALAALDADDRLVMTAALVTVGVCHVTTAVALRPAAAPGRLLLGLGGAATVLVAAFPLPSGGGGSPAHAAGAAVAFGALAAWPALAWRKGSGVPVSLRPAVSVGAAAVLLGLVAWFAVELGIDGGRVGLAERVAAAAQATWPLLAVLRLGYGESEDHPADENGDLAHGAEHVARDSPDSPAGMDQEQERRRHR